MNYLQTKDYLFTRLPMFSRIGAAAIKKDLHNTVALCQSLSNPHQQFKSIHVAGTNGKGSVSHMLAAILQTAGYKTGLYTSPHLHDFRERIKINGEMISKAYVIDFTKRIQPMIDELEPSFFEITVAMAFEYFAKEQVDIAVIEVGLGGRLDSTNIITPELSVITNIGWDHMNILGYSLKEIAFEKAGIIKKNIPVVIGETIPETKEVFLQKAKDSKAPVLLAQQQFTIQQFKTKEEALFVELREKETELVLQYEIDLPGIYQTNNLVTVLTAIRALQKLNRKISEQHIQSALRQTKKINGLHGRWEVIHKNPTVVLDVGHNEDGITQIIQQIKQTIYNHLRIVIGMVKDKEVEKVLALLPKEAVYYFTRAQIPRAMPELELQNKALLLALKGERFTDVNLALNAAIEHSSAEDLILVCGSVYLVGEVKIERIG